MRRPYKSIEEVKMKIENFELMPTPRSLVLFITGKCNATCTHCFYAKQLNQNNDVITLENLTKILSSLNTPTTLSLTGGEPFVLNTIQEILECAFVSPNISSISIPTNGYFVERIKKTVMSVTQKYPKHLHLQFSLDGLASTHDAIRGLEKGFEKILEVTQWAREYSKTQSNFSYMISTTVMKRNLDDIRPLVHHLKLLDLEHKLTFVRGNSFSTFNVPKKILRLDYDTKEELPRYQEIEQLVQDITKRYPDYFNAFSQKKVTLTLDVLREKSQQFVCRAGAQDGVIFHDGTVGVCEQVVPFGHLSQWDWNLEKAWNSSLAMEHRKMLRGCSCIHGCNISTIAKNG